MASSLSFRKLVNGSSFFITSRISNSQVRSAHYIRRQPTFRSQTLSKERPIRQLAFGKKQKAGRNSSGRITSFHRGGGAKRLGRVVDMKRNTPGLGVVERIEYDPNRTSRLALVKWVEGAAVDRPEKVNTVEKLAPPKLMFSPTRAVKGQFALSSIPGLQQERKVSSFVPRTDYVVVGLPEGMDRVSKSPFKPTSKLIPRSLDTRLTNVRDVFLSAFSSKADKTPHSVVTSLGLPRIALVGARPEFFVARLKDGDKDNETVNEIKRWDKDSKRWAHMLKRKAAVSWSGREGRKMLGLVGGADQPKLKSRSMVKQKRLGKLPGDRVPVSYILATHEMKAGHMVMNRDPPKKLNDELMRK